MLIRFLHSITLRIIEFTIGMALIGGSLLRDVTVAFPMVILGGALAVTAIVDVSILELLVKACGVDAASSHGRHA